MSDRVPDVINAALDARPGSELARLRNQRPKLKEMTQANYLAVMRPENPRNFSFALRAALATRMARLWKCEGLAEQYESVMDDEDPGAAELALADPAWWPDKSDGWFFAVLRHVDLVTRLPKDTTEADIAALYSAGLDDRDIVTLTGLIAFVNYQILVVAGLSALKRG
ncbi:CMD domain protein [Aureimonas fodinaquatilis]|uniref:CMD domain protein n=1 Tax=Aureimonas fodinaquatilis TaxID=2565783 RepID=A0A5B0DVP4_9HYPH|nr:CMD domain protein [Aureimonas fodinaquatilis]KAA0970418.1 CMD domain protein [Aureimonas fodinaquatilis]